MTMTLRDDIAEAILMTEGIISTHENALLAADEILRIIHRRLFSDALPPMSDQLFPVTDNIAQDIDS